MTTIAIPTTVFAKKVVFAQRGIPFSARTQKIEIKLSEDDEIFDLLKYNGQLRQYSHARNTLTEWLYFHISPTIARQLGGDVYAIGAYLDRQFKRELCKNVAARHESSTEKVFAIREYLSAHALDEDDYSHDAAIKRVQRHFTQKKMSKLAMIPLPNVGKKLPIVTKNVLYTDSELEAMYLSYRRQYPIYFFTKRRIERKELPMQCRAWIWRHIGKRPPQYIAEKMGINPATVWKRVNAFKREFEHRPMPTPSFFPPHADRT
jgi:hypothetical protein